METDIMSYLLGKKAGSGGTTYSDFVGTDGTADGTHGLVPAPLTTDEGKFLNANGSWEIVDTSIPDTGWVDITEYLNTNIFAPRDTEGRPLVVRRRGNQVFWSGEVYCKTAPNSKTAIMFSNLPSWIRPVSQNTGFGVHYQTSTNFTIFVGFGEQVNVTVAEANSISVTPDWQGYVLNILGGYLTEEPFPDLEQGGE